jgi:hypothetical protein
LGGRRASKLSGFLEAYSRETRATHDFFAGIESPGLRNASANFGHFDVLRILKT